MRPGKANARGKPGAADRRKAVAAISTPATRPLQPLPPLERYDPHLPDDKLALYEITPVRLLAGSWQGPGLLRDLIRAARLAR